jgi:hypothetical protein
VSSNRDIFPPGTSADHRTTLLAEYAYVLRPGGILYTVTDVKG